MALNNVSKRLEELMAEAGLVHLEVEAGTASGPDVFWSTAGTADRSPGTQIFLLASITKPVVGTLALQLAAEGRLGLSERVSDYLSEFRLPPFRAITLRHLLTHTSGLPDQLPGNAALRAAHASLDEFLVQLRDCQPEFSPGTRCGYSSMGFLLLAEIMRRLEGIPAAEQLDGRVLRPTGMHSSWLGIPNGRNDLLQAAIPNVLPAWQVDGDEWNWNSAYWRSLGVPWGGLFSTAADLGRFCRMLLRGGCNDDGNRVLSSSLPASALRNQTATIPELSDRTAEVQPWGYGWRLEWPAHSSSFGDFVPATAFGHWGDCGTMLWLDVPSQTYVVVLTTTPFDDSRETIRKVSNLLTTQLL